VTPPADTLIALEESARCDGRCPRRSSAREGRSPPRKRTATHGCHARPATRSPFCRHQRPHPRQKQKWPPQRPAADSLTERVHCGWSVGTVGGVACRGGKKSLDGRDDGGAAGRQGGVTGLVGGRFYEIELAGPGHSDLVADYQEPVHDRPGQGRLVWLAEGTPAPRASPASTTRSASRRPPPNKARDRELARQLWDRSADLLSITTH
jgi:hypothetical protein